MRTWIKWTLLALVLAVPATAYAAYQQINSGSCPFVDACPCD